MTSGFPRVDTEDETTYGSGHSAFYMAQNRSNQAPVHVDSAVVHVHGANGQNGQASSSNGQASSSSQKKKRNCCFCWAVGFRTETWINLTYNLLLNMILGTFCWSFFTALTLLGSILLPFCIGIPILLGMLQLARFLARADVGLANLGAEESSKIYRVKDSFLHADQNFRGWARSVGCSCQSYSDFFFLWLCKMPIAWFGFFVTLLCFIGSGALIVAPIVYASCDTCMKNGNLCFGDADGNWSDGNCGGWKIDSVKDTFGLSALGVLAMIVTLHISNGLAYLSKELTRCALASDREGGMNTGLLSAQHGQQGAPGVPVSESDYCTCQHTSPASRPSSNLSTPLLKSSTQPPPIVIILDESKQEKHSVSS